MKNRKKILIGIIAVITVLCAFVFAGCSDKCEHQWADATCTAPKNCSLCNETEGEAKGHSYKSEYDVSESKHWYQCTVCESKKDEADHTWNIPAATEESDKFCTVCNYVAEYQIGHVHTFDTVLSYDDEGHYYAASCGHTQEKKDYAFHDFETSTVEATCTEQGYTLHTCDCGKEVKDEYKSAHGHEFCTTLTKDGAGHWYAASCVHSTERKDYDTHRYTPLVTEPTCTEQGYTTYTCTCGDSYVSDYTDAKGHSVAEWTEGTATLYDARSCKHEVTYSGTCSSCTVLQTKTEYIEMHAFTEKTETPATCISEGLIYKFCKNNGCKYYVDSADRVVYEEIKYTDTNAHNWVEVTGESYTHKCSNGECKATKTTVTGGASASVSKDDIKNVDEIKLDKATIGLDAGVQTALGALGTGVEIAAGTLEGTERENAINSSNLSEEDKALLGTNKIYNFTVNNGDVDDLGGDATIKIPYTLGDNEDPDNIIVWYVKAGVIEPVSAVYIEENGEGYVTFTTDHFSYYTVTTIKPEQLCKHLGHDLKNAHTVLPTCTDIGYSVCLRCGEQIKESIVKPLGHSWQTTVVSENSCAQNGVTEYKCSVCDFGYETVVPATGHYFALEAQVSANCTASGSMTYGCIYCDSGYSVTLPQLSHNYISKTVSPTCEERGYTEKTCTLCADTIYVNFTEATGHTPDTAWHKDPSGHYHVCITCGAKGEVNAHTPGEEATEQFAQICTECEYVIVPQLSHTHSLTKVPAVPADCVTVGNVEYYTCVCGKWFRDAEAKELITNHTSVIEDAKGHTYENLKHQDSTCTEVGYTAGIKCSVCNTIIKGHVEIPAHGHILKTEETAPTCTEAGKIVKYCLYCENAYSEESIPALGHKHIGAITAPTCTEDGYTTFTCTRCNDSYEGDKKDMLGHSYSGLWLTSETAHWHECTRCQAKSDEGTHTPDREEPTATHAKSCTKCGYVIADRLDHVHTACDTVSEKAPTCTVGGNIAYYVCDCGEWFYDESCEQIITDTAGVMVKPLGHKLSYVEKTEPTCTDVGYTAGYYCERCKTYLSGHEEIPAPGHKYSTEWESDENEHWHECACSDKTDVADHSWNAENATEETDKHCTICNYVAEQQLSHTHKFDRWTDETPASCTEPGIIGHYTCTCGLYFDSDRNEVTDLTIPAPGHKYSTEWESDENEHWHECECSDKTDVFDHIWNVENATEETDKHCIICNYVAEQQLPHTHKFDSWTDETPASCTEPGIIGHYTCTCGLYFDSDRNEVTDLTIPAPGHKYSTEWESDENEHWRECECSDKTDVADHTYEDGKCSVCDREATEVFSYEYSEEYYGTTVSFMSDKTFTTVIWQLSIFTGQRLEITKEGTWTFIDQDTVGADIHGYLQCFTVDANGNLTLINAPEDCSHENSITHTVPGTCKAAGYVYTGCNDCQVIVALRLTDLTGHSYGEDGVCTVCGDENEGGTDEPEVTVIYTYTYLTDTENVTFTFMSDGTFTEIGTVIADGKEYSINESGTWQLNSAGELIATLNDVIITFTIDAEGNLELKGVEQSEATVRYTYKVNNDYVDITISFLSDYTLTIVGKQFTGDGVWENFNDTGTWTFNKDGNIEAVLYGETMMFVINEDGSLTLIGGGAEPEPVTELYVFTLKNDNLNITISFMSDFNFEAYGYYTDEKGNQVEYKDSFWWRYASDTAVMAILDGDFRVFEIGEDGKTLTLIDTDDESATNVYTYEYETEFYDATLSFKSTYKLIATGWRLDPETGEYLEQFTSEGWWYIDEFGFIVADIGANYGDFILLKDGSIILKEDCTHPETETMTMFDVTCLLTGYKCTYCTFCKDFVSEEYVDPLGHEFGEDGVCIRCDVKETDTEPTETYKYEYEDEEVSYVISFLSNNTFTLTMLKGQIEEGVDKDYLVGDWRILNDGTLSANLLGFEFFRFVIGEDGELTVYVCPHENTYTETHEPSCDEPGTSFTYCHECGEMIGSQHLEPKGHDYDEYGNCLNCGRSENEGGEHPDIPGVNPDIKDVAYTYSGENRFNLTLYSDGSANGTKMVPSADGVSYIYMINASWSKDESGKVITVYEKTEIYTFTVDEYGNLTLTNTESNSCAHEDTRTEPDVINCEQGGFRRIVCNTCGLTVSSEFVSPKEHSFGEDGSCTNCGYIPCKHENTVTDTMFHASCLLSGYEYTRCVDCDAFISENYLDPTGHDFNDEEICIYCGASVNDPEPTETYKYEYEDEEIHYVMSFLSNETFTLTMLKGQVEEGVEKDFFVGSWFMNDNGIIYTMLHGNDAYKFAIDEAGNLYEYECKHTETKTEIIEATCESSGNIREYCAECGEKMKETYIDSLGHDIDENGECTRCDYVASGDHEIPVYKYQDEGLELTFCKDYTVTGTRNFIFSNGMTSTQYLKGFWSIEKETNRVTTELSGITYVFDIINEKELVLVSQDSSDNSGSEGGEGGSVTECKHENRYDNTIAPSCNSEGYVITVCKDCEQTLFEKPIPPIDHSYDGNGVCINCGYSENGYVSDCKHQKIETVTVVEATCTISGYQVEDCTECGNDVSETYIEPLGHEYDENGFCVRCKRDVNEPAPTEVYTFTLVDEYVDYSFSFNSDSTYRFTGIETDGNGNRTPMTFVGTWTLSEDGKTINTFFLGSEFVSFELGENGTLTMQGGGSSGPSCAHENVTTESADATCSCEGYIRTVCESCGEIIKEEILPVTDHSYDENGVCVNCSAHENGFDTECAHENVTTVKEDATCSSDGYIKTVCTDCGVVTSEKILIATGHFYDDSGSCINCGSKKGSGTIIDSGFNGIITDGNEGETGSSSMNFAA